MKKSAKTQKKRKASQVGAQRSIKANLPKLKGPSPLKISNGPKPGDVRVKRREFICNVAGSSSLSIFSYDINPGRSMFPWLSSIATSFESYKLHALRMYYEPTCPVTTSGSVWLGIDYDITDPLPITEQALSETEGAACVPAYEQAGVKFDVTECSLKRYYVLPSGSLEERDCDVGSFICGVSANGNVALGKLFVEYDLTLSKPQFPQPIQPTLFADSASLATNPTNLPGPATQLSAWSPFGTDPSALSVIPQRLIKSVGEDTGLFTYDPNTLQLTADPTVRGVLCELWMRGISASNISALTTAALISGDYITAFCSGANSGGYGTVDTALTATTPWQATVEARLYKRVVFWATDTMKQMVFDFFMKQIFWTTLTALGIELQLTPIGEYSVY